jgi:hypothetical protein
VKIKLVEPKRARVKRAAVLMIMLAAALMLASCGSGNIKDLLKDSPEEKEQSQQ